MRILIIIIVAFTILSCEEVSDLSCTKAILLGPQSDCQILGNEVTDLILMKLETGDTALVIKPNDFDLKEVGTTINIQYNTVNGDSLVCNANVTPRLLVEITSLNCN